MIKKTFKYVYNEQEQTVMNVQVVTFFGIPVFTSSFTSNYPIDIKNIKGDEHEEPKGKIGFGK